jgi:imidazolonepropionase-like amidohydrolase/Tol biopolymer transport system component
MSRRVALLALVSLVLSAASIAAQESPQAENGWRTIESETTEVTAPDVAVSPDGAWLVFTLLGHLYRVPTEGGEAEQLTFGPYYDSEPAASPDGEHVAFVSDRDGSEGNIFVLDLPNRRIRQVTHEVWAAKPRWSPDGQQLVYLSYDMEAEQQFPASTPVSVIRVIAAGGGEPRSVTQEAAVVRTVFFLPDGRVGYVRQLGSTRARIEALSLDGGRNAIDSVIVLAGLVRELIPDFHDQGFFFHRDMLRRGENARFEEWVYRPLMGREERRLAAMSHTGRHPRADIAADGSALYLGDQGRLWRVDLRTGVRDTIPFRATAKAQVRKPTPPRRPLGLNARRPVSIATPRLSPDGQRLVFAAAGFLWEQPAAGGPATRVTDGSSVERDPAFSPDGRQLAFVRSAFGRDDLVVHDFGSDDTRVIDSGVPYGQPDWSPDGFHVVFSDGQRIVALHLESGATKTLTTASAWLPRPHFSDDGRSLFFSAKERGTGTLYELALAPDNERSPGARPRPLTELDRHLSTGLVSPDGRWLAFRRNTEIWLARRGSEPIREKDIRLLSAVGGDGFAFTPEGSALVYSFGGRVLVHLLQDSTLDAAVARRPDEVRIQLELSPAVPRPRLLRRVRLLDFETGSFGRETSLLVESGRIRTIGPEAERDLPEGTEILDAAGRYAIPGLFDMHVHVSRQTTEEGFLAYGITSVRDCGWWIGWQETMSDRGVATSEPVPRHFYAGGQFLGARPASTDVDLLLHDEEEARVYVRRWMERGAHFVKLYGLSYSLDGGRPRWLHRAVADEAHRMGIPVAGHGMTLEEVVNGITLGFAVIEHTTSPIPVHDDVLQLMAAAETRWDPNLGMPGGAVGTTRLLRLQPERLLDPKLVAFTPPQAVAMAPRLYPWARTSDLEHIWRVKLANVLDAHRRGIQLLIGTDVYVAGEGDQAFVGSALHWEMEHFVEAGIPPLEVLRIATRDAAEAVGAENDLGTLMPGKLADIVLLDANPLEDIQNTQSIWRVIKGGWVFDPEQLRPDPN